MRVANQLKNIINNAITPKSISLEEALLTLPEFTNDFPMTYLSTTSTLYVNF